MLRTTLLFLSALGLALAPLSTRASAEEAKGKVVKPFNGKDLTGWKFKGDPARSQWVMGYAALDPKDPHRLTVEAAHPADGGAPQLINRQRSEDIYTEQKFGDCKIEMEFMIPKDSNSGIY